MKPTASNPNASRRWLLALPAAAAVLYLFNRQQDASRDVVSVDVEAGRALFEAQALVIDVRNKAAYEARHIVNAVSIPLRVLEAAIPQSIAHAKDQPILVYCGDGLSIGPEATAILNKAGYAKAVNLKSGIEGWAAAKLPIQGTSA